MLARSRAGDDNITYSGYSYAVTTEIDFDELEASDVLEVRISVPPPLEAKLTSYSDRFYGGPGSPAAVASLGSIDAFDVICDHGKLTGKVEHHNPNSTSERITFSLDTPEGPRPNVDLIGSNAFTNATDFATFVEGLALAGADGTNLITVEAWKPINQLVSQGPSRQSVTLRAVPPTAGALINVAPDTTVRRDVGDMSFTYSRALVARLEEQVDNSAWSTASDLQPASMQLLSVDLRHVRLRPAPGDHRLHAVAFNDFDSVAGPDILIHAPAPEVRTNTIDWIAQPFRERTRLGVADELGHSNTSVRAPYRVRFALSAGLEDPNGTSTIGLGNNPLHTSDLTLTVPATGALRVGSNPFTVRATNEFAVTSVTKLIHRRDLVFDCDDGIITMHTVPPDPEIWLRVTIIDLDG